MAEWRGFSRKEIPRYDRLDAEIYMRYLILSCFIENDCIHAYPIHVYKDDFTDPEKQS